MKTNRVTKQRNITADFVKGVLILCVMYGHSVTMINGLRGVTWTNSPVNVFVSAFEMPLFILISGFFLFFSLQRRSYKDVLIKRIVSIAIPLAVWEGVPAIYSFVITTINNGFSFVELLKIPYKCIFPGKLWFLAAYLICSIIVIIVEWVLSFIKSENKREIFLGVTYILILIAMNFINLQVSNVQFLFVFFLIGFYVSKYDLLNRKNTRIFLIVSSILFILLYPFYNAENSFYILGTYLNPNHIKQLLPLFLHRFLLSICGCIAIYFMSNLICQKKPDCKLVSSISNLGIKTMELYILSMYMEDLLIKLVGLVLDERIINNITAPLVFGPIFLVVLTVICLLLIKIINKSKILNKILFAK